MLFPFLKNNKYNKIGKIIHVDLANFIFIPLFYFLFWGFDICGNTFHKLPFMEQEFRISTRSK